MFSQFHHDEQDRVQAEESLLAVTHSFVGFAEHEEFEERENCC